MGNRDMVTLLLDSGGSANLTAMYSEDRTLLMRGIENDKRELAALLLAHGANVNASLTDFETNKMVTALDIARKQKTHQKEWIAFLQQAAAKGRP
jgi:ankyrin repeat protein